MGVTRVVCRGPNFPLLRNGQKKNESEESRERSDIVYIDKRKKKRKQRGEKGGRSTFELGPDASEHCELS